MRLLIAAILALTPALLRAEANSALDERKILESVAKSLSLPPTWKLKLSNVQPSTFPGLLQANVEVLIDNQSRSQRIFISTDGSAYIVGNAFDTAADMDAQRRQKVSLRDAPSKGPAGAPVTVVEFSDFQCGSCKKAHEVLENEKPFAAFGDKVRFVYKHYPLPNHNWARPAAIAAECARQQSPQAFWAMQNEIFALQNAITAEGLRTTVMGIAGKLGLKPKVFEACLDSPAAAARVNADVQDGNAIGINSTPSFMINGRVIAGFPGPNGLKEIVQEFLKRSGGGAKP